MGEILLRQLTADYCCTPGEVGDHRNHFTVYEPREGRRTYQENGPCFLKAAVFRSKLLMTGQPEIIRRCSELFADEKGEWFMDGAGLCSLDQLLREYGFRVGMAHPFFISAQRTEFSSGDYDVRWYEEKEIERFRGDPRFRKAYSFDPLAPDMLGVAAVRDGQILGMAGASADSAAMWQIGIDVDEAWRGRGIAAALVTLLKNRLLEMGVLPFYGTAMSHIASQRVCLRAGFLPAWAELTVKRAE